MLEVLDRAFRARMTRWIEGPVSLSTPDIIFLDTEHFPAPDFARSFLVESVEGRRLVTSESKGKGPLFNCSWKVPLSYLRSMNMGMVVHGEGTTGVRSRPELIPEVLSGSKQHIFSIEDAFELRRDARSLVRTIVNLRGIVGHSTLIYAPGIMDPGNLALLCYLGIDLFDSSLLIYQSARGKLILPNLTVDASEAGWLLPDPSPEHILKFNLEAVWNELKMVQWAIERRKLRDLVETRVTSDPWAVAVLRLLDQEGYEYQEEMAPVVGGTVHCNTKQSLHRPDVQRWRRRILDRYRPPEHKRILLLLPCSARKPYSTSKTHKIFRKVIDTVGKSHLIHEVIVTSPLGVVPREIELLYPASQYDIPVTGDWDCFERSMILEMLNHLNSFGYDQTICHMDEGFVAEAIDCEVTAAGDPTSRESLDNLRNLLEKVCDDLPTVPRAVDREQDMASLARFQFGPGGEHLLDGAEVTGRYPRPRVVKGRSQLGMLSPERGMISLTIEGAEKLREKDLNVVQIGSFDLKGNLFAVGVESADPFIRIGDEAIIVREGEVVGVGVASMNGREMMDLSRGEAVRVRHTA
jgi:archaeosine synthase